MTDKNELILIGKIQCFLTDLSTVHIKASRCITNKSEIKPFDQKSHEIYLVLNQEYGREIEEGSLIPCFSTTRSLPSNRIVPNIDDELIIHALKDPKNGSFHTLGWGYYEDFNKVLLRMKKNPVYLVNMRDPEKGWVKVVETLSLDELSSKLWRIVNKLQIPLLLIDSLPDNLVVSEVHLNTSKVDRKDLAFIIDLLYNR
jgi:hypothetical protein